MDGKWTERRPHLREAGHRRVQVFFGAVTALMLVIFGLTGIVWVIAGDAGGMERGMLHYAPPEVTGMPADEYPAAALLISDYITGAADDFQMMLVGTDGEEIPAFNQREWLHMADVRRLLKLDWLACRCALAAAVAGLAILLVLDDRRAFARGGLACLRVLGILAAALILWALVNFDGLFVTFHKIAFRNDLWLLDPRTSLLIRLMPSELFIHLGMKGLLPAVMWVLLLGLGCWYLGKRSKQDGESDGTETAQLQTDAANQKGKTE